VNLRVWCCDPSLVCFWAIAGVSSDSGCQECMQCKFDEFESEGCSSNSNTVCKPYQYSLSTERKIVVACLPILVMLLALFSYLLLARGFIICQSQSTSMAVLLYIWSTFLGAYDIVSDWMLLILIEPANPYMIFWVALIALLISSGIQVYCGWKFSISSRTLSSGTEMSWRWGPSLSCYEAVIFSCCKEVPFKENLADTAFQLVDCSSTIDDYNCAFPYWKSVFGWWWL
jgi:hypothetical protein